MCVRVCVLIPFLLLFLTLYMFLHLTTMHSCTFWKGWVGRGYLYLLVWMSFGSFSLRELTCMHYVYLVLWTCKVLCGSVLSTIIYIYKNHSFIQNLVDACWICCGLYLSLSPEWRPGMSDVLFLSGISGLSFDSSFLSPLLFFLPSPLALSVFC